MSRYTLLSFSLFFLFLQSVTAQHWQIGAKGGLSLPNLSSSGSSEVSKGYKSISGPDFELFAEYSYAEQISVEAGLEWSTQGGQKSGVQAIPASSDLAQYFPPGTQYLYANFTSTVRLQYIMLPVLLKYTMDLSSSGRWKLYWDAGFFGALLMTADASASGSSQVYLDKGETQPISSLQVQFDSTGNIKNQLHKGNFGVEGNMGVLCQWKTFGIFAEAGGNYGFVNLQKDSRNGVNHTGALIFRLGVSLNLNRKPYLYSR